MMMRVFRSCFSVGFALLLATGCGGGKKSRSVQEPSDVVAAGGQEGAAEGGYSRRPSDGARNEEGGSSGAVAGASAVSGKLTDELNTPLQCPVTPNPMNFGPLVWPAGMADTRWAKNETDVASVQSSAARPVEVCGILGQITWLMSAVCPDGKNPYPDGKAAHMSRAGNVGSGGRCGTIIDLYVVPCPDKQYEVYMDMYQCMPGESFN